MEVQRTVSIVIQDDADLRNTVEAFRRVQQSVATTCFNDGKPLNALQLQRCCYHDVKDSVSSQMTITALRLVAGAYVSARTNYRRRLQQEASRKARFLRKGWKYVPRVPKQPGVCQFVKPSALFLVGDRGRDADFRKDGTLSIWTTGGRKRLTYTIPAHFQERFRTAKQIDSVTVVERNGKLVGPVSLTIEVPDPVGIHPVGIDLNETNALVAVDADGNKLFVSGRETKVRNNRSYQLRKRLQKKLASHKAQRKDTRSLRRLLKRQGRKRSNRTKTFAQQTAKALCRWAKPNSVLVFEDLNIPEPKKGAIARKSVRRRLSRWDRGIIRQCCENKAQEFGHVVAQVDPAYTSRQCSRCGLIGQRKRHRFVCKSCGFAEHADVNAAVNIRNRFVASRRDGDESTSPEALSSVGSTGDEGKPSPLGHGR